MNVKYDNNNTPSTAAKRIKFVIGTVCDHEPDSLNEMSDKLVEEGFSMKIADIMAVWMLMRITMIQGDVSPETLAEIAAAQDAALRGEM